MLWSSKSGHLKLSALLSRPFGLLILLAASACHSSLQPGHEAVFADCQPAPTQAELSECVETNLQQAEDVMQQALAELGRRFRESGPALLELLLDSQQQWEAFAAAQCDVETYYSRGGTAYQAYVDACMADFYRSRYEQLRWMIDNP